MNKIHEIKINVLFYILHEIITEKDELTFTEIVFARTSPHPLMTFN